MLPSISIVIPTYNRVDTLKLVLPSLLNQSLSSEDYEIIICDSKSEDGTDLLISNFSDKRIRFLPGKYNSRAEARNAGIENARGDIVLFTDADIIAEPDLLSLHLNAHGKYPGSAFVGREIQVNNIEEYEKAKSNPDSGRSLHPASRKTLPWLYFLTGNASVPKDILIKTGMFDPSFTGYGHEDLELGYRLKRYGLTIYYLHNAVNYHLHPVEWEERKRRFHLAGISTVRFYKKHHDPRIKLLLGWNFLSINGYRLLNAIPWIIKSLEKRIDKSPFAREIILQYHYLSGIIEGIEKPDEI